MSYIYGLISVVASVILAFIIGIPVISEWGLTYFHVEYFLLGFVAPIGYYYSIFLKEGAFHKQHILPGLSFGLIALFIILLIHYFVLSRLLLPFLPYINTVKLEIPVFVFGSIILPLFKIIGQIKCKKCNSGYFTEELLFKVSKSDYRSDIKKFIQLVANNSDTELRNFIKERRLCTGYSSKNHEIKPSTYSFYLITCKNCRAQYIVSQKNKENIDEISIKHSYKIIANTKFGN
ncbi:hypothetical protein H1D32_22900 [Anaerobacillus sp. CMMVII]|uniref:hypothetical protein n=1 Tax=Anaerobacillus sp. CMMVII TaxID=2755588 RepID=UPI0021B824C3|nr:hypothetical protein [Anaerobacillus sp. CMMVII]MCT8140294.1 hypothetical protein [Anaerobacillus sp. CMMVII]